MVSERNQSKPAEADESSAWENSVPDFVLLSEIKPPQTYRIGTRANAAVTAVPWSDPDHE